MVFFLLCTLHVMDCPSCHTENASHVATCTSCGRSLRANTTPGNGARRSRSAEARRRKIEASEAAAVDSNNPAAWRAYRIAVWSVVPGFGLLLGPLALVLGVRAVRAAGDDLSARNRSAAAILFGAGSMLTQWLGAILLYYGWRG
jgi:hypothetical protein